MQKPKRNPNTKTQNALSNKQDPKNQKSKNANPENKNTKYKNKKPDDHK